MVIHLKRSEISRNGSVSLQTGLTLNVILITFFVNFQNNKPRPHYTNILALHLQILQSADLLSLPRLLSTKNNFYLYFNSLLKTFNSTVEDDR